MLLQRECLNYLLGSFRSWAICNIDSTLHHLYPAPFINEDRETCRDGFASSQEKNQECSKSLRRDFQCSPLSGSFLLAHMGPLVVRWAHVVSSGQGPLSSSDATSRLKETSIAAVRPFSTLFPVSVTKKPHVPVSAAMRWWSLCHPGSLRDCREQPGSVHLTNLSRTCERVKNKFSSY